MRKSTIIPVLVILLAAYGYARSRAAQIPPPLPLTEFQVQSNWDDGSAVQGTITIALQQLGQPDQVLLAGKMGSSGWVDQRVALQQGAAYTVTFNITNSPTAFNSFSFPVFMLVAPSAVPLVTSHFIFRKAPADAAHFYAGGNINVHVSN